MTGLEVLDSAVKIGLGAAISAVSALAGAAKSHQRDINKIDRTRRLDALEGLAVDATKVFGAWRVVLMFLSPPYEGIADDQTPVISAERWAELEKRDKELFEKLETMSSIPARLRLLRLTNQVKIYYDVLNTYTEFRDKLITGRKVVTKSEFEVLRKRLSSRSKDFFDSLGAAYA